MKQLYYIIISFVCMLLSLAMTIFSPAKTGEEAIAAAKQVKTGAEYLEARVTMNLWEYYPAITWILFVIGIVFLFLFVKNRK